jgi:hypothetical protein
MEELSIYNCKFVYVKGSDNTVADALSHYPLTFVSTPKDAENTAIHPYTSSEKNSVNVLIHPSPQNSPLATIAAIVDTNLPMSTHTTLSIGDKLVNNILNGYASDPWCNKLLSASKGMPELTIRDGLWFLGS